MLKISKKNIMELLDFEDGIFIKMPELEAIRVLKELITTGKSSFKNLQFEGSNCEKHVNEEKIEFVSISTTTTTDISNYYAISDKFGVQLHEDFEKNIMEYTIESNRQELLSLGYY